MREKKQKHKLNPLSWGQYSALYLQRYDKKKVFCNDEKTNSTLCALTKRLGTKTEKEMELN